MPEITIPTGPIHSEPIHAIVMHPGERSPRANALALQTALDGIQLGAWDREILDWLAGWEPSTVATVCSWLHRVKEAAK
ncbi:hypothetical protein JYK22_21570, partial [Nonomuraea sp. RK-328]|nr:hypothetical protein [Nonomuraea sp. RK-328]